MQNVYLPILNYVVEHKAVLMCKKASIFNEIATLCLFSSLFLSLTITYADKNSVLQFILFFFFLSFFHNLFYNKTTP